MHKSKTLEKNGFKTDMDDEYFVFQTYNQFMIQLQMKAQLQIELIIEVI